MLQTLYRVFNISRVVSQFSFKILLPKEIKKYFFLIAIKSKARKKEIELSLKLFFLRRGKEKIPFPSLKINDNLHFSKLISNATIRKMN